MVEVRLILASEVHCVCSLDKRCQGHEALQPAHAGLTEIGGAGDVAGHHLQTIAKLGHEYERQLREAAR